MYQFNKMYRKGNEKLWRIRMPQDTDQWRTLVDMSVNLQALHLLMLSRICS
jgi:hypothetical protein